MDIGLGKFLEGMYFEEEGDLLNFKGLIAISRRYVDWTSKKKEGVTFITVGYDFGKYLDIATVVVGKTWLEGTGKNTAVEGL